MRTKAVAENVARHHKMREQAAIHKEKDGGPNLSINPFDEAWGKGLDVKPVEYKRLNTWNPPVRPKNHVIDWYEY